MATLTFLGTGTSTGVPMIGRISRASESADPRDRRTRCSAWIQFADGTDLLIDTSPELRLQALAAGLAHVDAVLFTHAHADHTAGLDDLRAFNSLQQEVIPVYADATVEAAFHQRFAYIFDEPPLPFFGGKPALALHRIDGPFAIHGHEIVPVPVPHGRATVLGFRFGRFAYVTDAAQVPTTARDRLRGLDLLVLNALRARPHPVHLSIAEALEVIADVQPKRAYLTHMSDDVLHAEDDAKLPPGVHFASDGLRLEIPE
ncbi:MAG: MBL fold metallo-hydrolase [Thermomicrobiales bacterium]